MHIKRLGAVALAALATTFAWSVVGGHAAPKWGPDIVGGYSTKQLIAQVQPGVMTHEGKGNFSFGFSQLDQILRLRGVKEVRRVVELPFGDPLLAHQIGLDRYYYLKFDKGANTPQIARELSRYTNAFVQVEIDGIGGPAQTFPNDPSFNVEWGLHNTGQNIPNSGVGTVDADIDAPEAWALATGLSNRTIAVIDSGVDVTHPELASKIVGKWNTVTNNQDVSDGCNHGTHCAGTAGALTNNGVGIAGVSWGVQIMAIKVLTGCGGNETDCGEGMIYAADNGANVCTMSLQYYTGSTFFRDSVDYAYGKGVLLIAATGNSQGNNVAYPAKFVNCMGVGATTNKDLIASFSNWGAEVDVSAPGQDVYSCRVGNSYGYLSGTSMATPHTSGLACLIWSINPSLTNAEVWTILRTTADDKGTTGFDQFFGWGRINAHKAVQAALATLGTDLLSFNVILGTLVSGGLNELKTSDDSKMSIDSGPGFILTEPNAMIVEFAAKTGVQNRTTVKVDLEHRESLALGQGVLQMYNYSTNSWTSVANFGFAISDTVVTASGLSAADYVDGSGNLRLRVKTYTDATLAPYRTDLDLLSITVS